MFKSKIRAFTLILSGSLMALHAYAVELSFEQIESAIAKNLSTTDSLTQYHAHKARMWLSYAKNEYSENSLTVAGDEALTYSKELVNGLHRSQKISLITPIVSVSQVMRRDLWWQIEYFKQNGAIQHSPQALAEAEVMLVWAAAEYCELGWRHAKEHFFAVEQRLYQVNQSLLNQNIPKPNLETEIPSLAQLNGKGCNGVNSNFWPLQINGSLFKNNETVSENSNQILIENVVHFALDQADLNDEGRKVLDQIVNLLDQYNDIQITLVGHTDKRSSQFYNLKLSQRRIDTVREYLISKGISVDRIAEHAKGKVNLIHDDELFLSHAKSRRVEIQFHDVEAKKISVQPQWRDLHVESVK